MTLKNKNISKGRGCVAETKFLDSVGLAHMFEKINAKFSKTGHTHTKAEITDFAHTHNDLYYTEAEVDGKLSGKAASSHKHGAGDITSVNASAITGVIASANLPSFVDDVLEGYYGSDGVFYQHLDTSTGKYSDAYTGEAGKIYVDFNTNKTYRWSGSKYVVVSETIALGETASTAYRGDRGKVAYDHAAAKGSAFANGLYKITTNAQGHVTAATAVAKSDITALGIPAQDTVYTHPTSSGNKHIPSGGAAGQFLKWSADGTAVWAADNNTTYSNFKGATSSAAGGSGLVPAPATGAANRYLRSDGTWQVPPDNNTWNALRGATASAAGSAGYVAAPAAGQQGAFLRGDGAWTAISKATVGLGNVDNTADSAKSVKSATSAGYATTAGTANALKVTELTTQNLNDIKTVGLYCAGGSNSVNNKPTDVDAFGLEVKKTAGGYIAQVLTESNVHTIKTWIRQFNSNAWSAWEYYFDSRHTPTWSQVSGKPSFATVATSGSYNDLSNKPTSLKNPNPLTISLNGTSQGAYDGSAAKSINVTPSSIGAAPSSHTHNYAGSSSAGGSANWAKGADYANGAFSSVGVSTNGSGSAYTAFVSDFSLGTGASIVMIPNVTSTTTTPTLNVSSTGAKNIRMRLSSSTSSTIPLIRADFLTQYKPVKLTYDGLYWVIDDFIQPDANNLYGTLISRGSSAPSSGTAGFIYIQTT
jgi:hypothetical protein